MAIETPRTGVRGCSVVSAAMALVLAAVGSLAAGEWTSVSRYGATGDLTATTGEAFHVLDLAALVDRCRDHDGCTMTLKMDGPAGIEIATQKVFLSEHSLQYGTSINATVRADNNVLREALIEVSSANAGCSITDADDQNSLLDTNEGFSLHFFVDTQDAAWICALHVED